MHEKCISNCENEMKTLKQSWIMTQLDIEIKTIYLFSDNIETIAKIN